MLQKCREMEFSFSDAGYSFVSGDSLLNSSFSQPYINSTAPDQLTVMHYTSHVKIIPLQNSLFHKYCTGVFSCLSIMSNRLFMYKVFVKYKTLLAAIKIQACCKKEEETNLELFRLYKNWNI